MNGSWYTYLSWLFHLESIVKVGGSYGDSRSKGQGFKWQESPSTRRGKGRGGWERFKLQWLAGKCKSRLSLLGISDYKTTPFLFYYISSSMHHQINRPKWCTWAYFQNFCGNKTFSITACFHLKIKCKVLNSYTLYWCPIYFCSIHYFQFHYHCLCIVYDLTAVSRHLNGTTA